MKQIFINDHNLTDEEVEYEVIRVKALIFNSNEEILLAHNNNTYQFPGGHHKTEESLEKTLSREIKEETGIDISINNGPYLLIKTYDDNYFNSNKKVCNKIYYYRLFTDKLPDKTKTNYDELERKTDFNLLYIKFKELENFLNNSLENGSIDKKIAREMFLAIKEYNNLYL